MDEIEFEMLRINETNYKLHRDNTALETRLRIKEQHLNELQKSMQDSLSHDTRAPPSINTRVGRTQMIIAAAIGFLLGRTLR